MDILKNQAPNQYKLKLNKLKVNVKLNKFEVKVYIDLNWNLNWIGRMEIEIDLNWEVINWNGLVLKLFYFVFQITLLYKPFLNT